MKKNLLILMLAGGLLLAGCGTKDADKQNYPDATTPDCDCKSRSDVPVDPGESSELIDPTVHIVGWLSNEQINKVLDTRNDTIRWMSKLERHSRRVTKHVDTDQTIEEDFVGVQYEDGLVYTSDRNNTISEPNRTFDIISTGHEEYEAAYGVGDQRPDSSLVHTFDSYMEYGESEDYENYYLTGQNEALWSIFFDLWGQETETLSLDYMLGADAEGNVYGLQAERYVEQVGEYLSMHTVWTLDRYFVKDGYYYLESTEHHWQREGAYFAPTEYDQAIYPALENQVVDSYHVRYDYSYDQPGQFPNRAQYIEDFPEHIPYYLNLIAKRMAPTATGYEEVPGTAYTNLNSDCKFNPITKRYEVEMSCALGGLSAGEVYEFTAVECPFVWIDKETFFPSAFSDAAISPDFDAGLISLPEGWSILGSENSFLLKAPSEPTDDGVRLEFEMTFAITFDMRENQNPVAGEDPVMLPVAFATPIGGAMEISPLI